ncbi:MAG: phage tail protein [Herpetosiphonaceae bacterium]|nr:MAG: phage tail protein [Herpetosiphonaceae bacterium]
MAEMHDPLTSFVFVVEIDGIVSAWSEASGLGTNIDVIETWTVDGNTKKPLVNKQPGQYKWDDITLKRPLKADMTLYQWVNQMKQGQVEGNRKNGSITLYKPDGTTEVARWNFFNAWPKKYGPSGLNATGNEAAMEEMILVHEGLSRIK